MKQPDVTMVEAMAELALAAGLAIMKHFGEARATLKADGSPVTLADQEAEDVILPGLERLFPGVPVVAEESAAAGIIPATGDDFLLVDPLDGTKEFIAGRDEFTVNIGWVSKGVPVAGVIFAPALNRLWFSGAQAETCEASPGIAMVEVRNRRRINVRVPSRGGLVALASRSHLTAATEAFLAELPVSERRFAGSSLKFCMLAEGQADVFAHFGPTKEWDTCAGHAILLAAGGSIRRAEGGLFNYGKRDVEYLNPGFVAAGDLAAVEAMRRSG